MMPFANIDVFSEFFTPQEYPVEILEITKKHDVVACCLNPPAKQFLAFMLFKEYYFMHDGISVFIQDPPEVAPKKLDDNVTESKTEEVDPESVEHDLSVPVGPPQCVVPLETLSHVPTFRVQVDEGNDGVSESGSDNQEFVGKLAVPSVLICTRKKFLSLVKTTDLMKKLTLVVCDNAHESLRSEDIKSQMLEILFSIRSYNTEKTSESQLPIRIVFLTVSLLHFYGKESDGFWRMEETFRKLEKLLNAKVDTSSDIVALLRYCNPPKEKIISCNPTYLQEIPYKLSIQIKEILSMLKKLLQSHTFDPVAAFGYDPNPIPDSKAVEILDETTEEPETDSIAEELKKISNPAVEPLEVIRQFETVLTKFGPWCADRAIILLIQLVDRLKVRTPYERHYLLLGTLHTQFVRIQARFKHAFGTIEPLHILQNYSTPKLIAVLEILRRFDLTRPLEPLRPKKIILEDDEEDEDEVEEQKTLPLSSKPSKDHKRRNEKRDSARKENIHSPMNKATVSDKEDETTRVNELVEDHQDTLTKPSLTNGSNELDSVKDTNETQDELLSSVGNDNVSHTAVKYRKEDAETLTPKTESDDFKINKRKRRYPKKTKQANRPIDHPLCGILFVEDRFDGRILLHFLKEAAQLDPKLVGLNPTLAVCSNPDFPKDSREAEMEHKKREENLRKFRYREANLLIGTSIVEDGIELPKANLVIRFDNSKSFRSYLLSKGRAQGYDAEFYSFSEQSRLPHFLKQIATYKVVEEVLLAHSVIPKVSPSTETDKKWKTRLQQYLCANLCNAIPIINRYCARLPSDTFTRLVPMWSVKEVHGSIEGREFFCTLRLPINSPVKWPIKGIPMPNDLLAKQVAALQTVAVLHKNGELDENLMPIGKEGVVQEPDLCILNEPFEKELGEFRPGSTKRRQYYDKQLANELVHCLPIVQQPLYLYWLKMVLTCPLPDEQNTRGRKLHPPELAAQFFGIILSKEISSIPAFPIYTRCGEVHVELVRITGVNTDKFTPENVEKMSAFHHYTFTSVLRLDKYLTLFDPECSENAYFVVPLKTVSKGDQQEMDTRPHPIDLDWEFIEQIWNQRDSTKPKPKTDEERSDFEFRKEDYEDAVVMPWYRNHDVPQYFYVAEICSNLTPRSQFPGCEFKTFDEYYQKKYRINIQCVSQPLLDVDHTSARLNFLTPRYVNRKGMALPTSSESTKKAKRENLEQKQILVPELCAIHPFTASLWRQAVCLPCILYRFNCLLLANNIRLTVASEIRGFGMLTTPKDFSWEPLSFGWSLSEVLALSCGESKITDDPTLNMPKEKNNKKERDSKSKYKVPAEPEVIDTEKCKPEVEEELTGFAKAAKEPLSAVSLAEALLINEKHHGKSANEILSEEMKKCKQPPLEIGMWSNEMAADVGPTENEFEEEEDELLLDPTVAFPSNLMMLDKNWSWGGRSRLFNHKVHRALYGSPTHWGEVWDKDAFIPVEDLDDPSCANSFDNDNASVNSDMSGSDASFLDEENCLKIQFHNGNTAEALDKRNFGFEHHRPDDGWDASEELWWQMDEDTDFGPDSPSCTKEESLRFEFESKIVVKAQEIKDIIPYESINTIPARIPRISAFIDTKEIDADKKYANLFDTLTPFTPPKACQESLNYMRNPEATEKTEATEFSFDYQPDLQSHIGPSPCRILQALTMSNANDGLNLERLETIGDSYLKYAITSYLFCSYENIHEGKLSHLRSKQVSNVHLYRLGRRRGLGNLMVAAKFEPHDNWLPPGYHIPKHLDKALIQSKLPPSHVSMAQVAALKGMSATEMELALKTHSIKSEAEFVPYNLVTQQSIPDKSIADCVEALIGAYLTSMGPLGALFFMSWLGLRVLPSRIVGKEEFAQQIISADNRKPNQLLYMDLADGKSVIVFDTLAPPESPLLRYNNNCEEELDILLKGYDKFEKSVGYYFRDRSYLLQAFTHASYSTNMLTDCYQRLEFLGDAILDYLITRHLYEDPRQHSPGSLTDLRSALVNNTIFASLAVKNGFHKYFRHSSPGLAGVLQKFVAFQEQHGDTLTQDYYLMDEEECEEAEDIEVPKALGDVFESVAGAIFLDSGMSLDAVWNVYYRIMKNEIEAFSKNVPKSPIRELLELEPETAKFGKPEKLWDGRRVRVTVEIFGVGVFRGIGRNYRIAKCTAAKCALRHVRKVRLNQSRR